MPYLSIATTLVMLTALVPPSLAQAWDAASGNGGRPGKPGIFDYYSLYLRWAPSYCAEYEGSPQACSGTRHLGFVLRSLSPMFRSGLWPEYCSDQMLTPQDTAAFPTLYPSPSLMEKEWAQHGTCSDLAPLSYFQLGKDLLVAIHIPSALAKPEHAFSSSREEIVRAFVQSNPRIQADGLTVTCSGRFLTGIHLCYDKTGTMSKACSKRESETALRSCPPIFTVRPVR